MTIPTSAATNAYEAAAKLAETVVNNSNGAQGNNIASTGERFQDLLSQAVTNVVESGRNVEAQTRAAVQGQGDMIDVVTAVAETEVALQSMVSMRDRVISSYEEIMRMPI